MIILLVSLFLILAAIFYALSLSVKGAKGNSEGEIDFLIILGYRVEKALPDEILKLRVKSAAEYLKKNEKVRVIPTGGITHSGQEKSEAEVMKELLLKEGIAENRILLEDKAKTTEDNFIYSKAIIDSFKTGNSAKIAFLSSECHLFRAGILAKKSGIEASSLPAESPRNKKAVGYLREAVILVYMNFKSLGGKKNGK